MLALVLPSLTQKSTSASRAVSPSRRCRIRLHDADCPYSAGRIDVSRGAISRSLLVQSHRSLPRRADVGTQELEQHAFAPGEIGPLTKYGDEKCMSRREWKVNS